MLEDLKELGLSLSEIWPVLAFIGAAIYGYFKLGVRVDKLEEKEFQDKQDTEKRQEDIDEDIKGVSQKINVGLKEINLEFKAVRKENYDNHIQTTKDISELKGMVNALLISHRPEKNS